MKFASVVVYVMAKPCNSSKTWTMRELIANVSPGAKGVDRVAVQRQIHRVLLLLEVAGTVAIERNGLGKACKFRWVSGEPRHDRIADSI